MTLELFVFLRRRKSRNAMPAVRCALPAHANLRLALRPGLPQDHHGAQRLGKQSGHEVNILRSIFLPELPNLKFRNAHKPDSTLECPAKGVNCLPLTQYTFVMTQRRFPFAHLSPRERPRLPSPKTALLPRE
jgi:hypothetical protein